MSEDDTKFDRRSVLKSVGTTLAVGTGFAASTGTVSAIEAKHRLTRAYADESRLRAAFEQHAGGVRRTLVEEGFVAEDFDFGSLEFDLDSDVTRVEPRTDDRVAGTTAIGAEESISALGMVSTSSDAHEIALFVQPERDEAYALVEPKAGGDRLVVRDDRVDAVTNSYTRCTSCCDENYRTEEEVDCTITDEGCVVLGTSCGCFDCDCGSMSTC